MKVTSFLACMYGSYTDQGLVDLGGIGMDQIASPEIPFTLTLKFFARCESELLEPAGKHRAEIVFMGDDKALTRNAMEFATDEQKRNANLMIDLGMKFESEGNYRVDFILDGQLGSSWPLSVRLQQA